MRGVSVIIPLYNHAQYIRQAIESVLAQGDVVGEIIVIDDGSTDSSVKTMTGLVGLDRRIVFWTQSNQGAHRTINTGLMRATCEYLAILNSDDVFLPGRLQRLTAALDRDQGADIASSSIHFIDQAGATIVNTWHASALAGYKSSGHLGLSLMNANFVMTSSNIVLRRSLIDRIGVFAPLRYAHDLDYLLRAAAKGTRLAFIDEPLISYRWHPTNTIKEDGARVKREWAIASAHYIHLIRTSPGFADRGWTAVEELMSILDRHTLTRAVQCCLLYFDRFPTDTLEHSQIFTDTRFDLTLAKMFV